MAQQVVVMASLVGLGLAGIVFLTRKLKGGKKKTPIPPDHGAFVERFQILPPPHPPPPAAPLPLTGKTFAVKDIFNVEGHVTGFGNLTWAETHDPATLTAPCITDVIKEGATLEGKTHMDDMAYSMLGASSLAGQPINPRAPMHLPGGSSSGSAVAVAAGLVDFALGTDTAGSIRIPAANCGVLGFRPTHGSISTVGVVPMAPSLDTVGLLARDPEILHHVGHTLLRQPFMSRRVPLRVVIADDLFDLSSCPRAPVTETVIAVTEQCLGPVVKYLKIGDLLARSVPSLSAFVAARGHDSASNGGAGPAGWGPAGRGVASSQGLQALAEAQRVLQRLEFRDCHGEWVAREGPALHDHVIPRVRGAAEGVTLPPDAAGPSGAPGMENGGVGLGPGGGASRDGRGAATIEETTEEKFLRAQALKVKEELRQALNSNLESDVILVLPAAPDLPLRLDAPSKALDEYRAKAMQIVAPASMSGLPQVVIPVGTIDAKGNGNRKSGGLPLAVSFMARSGADRFLLDATTLYAPALPLAYRELMASRRSRGQDQEGKAKGAQNGQDDKKSPAEVAKDNGNAAFKEKQYGTAVEHYTEAIRLNPRNPTYYANRAMAYLNLKNMPQVEADCTAALELDKKNVKALLRRGTAREFMGLYLEAYQDFQEAIVLQPTNKTALDGIRRLEQAGVLPG